MGSSTGYGWMSGAAIKPIALRVVYELAKAVKFQYLVWVELLVEQM